MPTGRQPADAPPVAMSLLQIRLRFAEPEELQQSFGIDDTVWVVLLLLAATVADYLTGPDINASAFYVLPVAWAGLRRGERIGIVAAFGAVLLNVITEHSHEAQTRATSTLLVNQAARMVVLVGAGAISGRLGGHQRSLTQQRDMMVAVNQQLETEQRDARALQELLIGPLPVHPAVDLGLHVATARILGGDAPDVKLGPGQQLAIALADVSGKGSPAALAGAVLLGLLDDAPDRFEAPGATLEYLNERLETRLPEDMFVTLFYGVLDLTQGRLTYASAAHDPPLVIRASGDVEELPGTGIPLGVFPGQSYSQVTVDLGSGDLLFCYTDGVTDIPQESGDRLGIDRLRVLVRERSGRPCPELVRSVAERATRGATEIPDDITLLAVRYLGAVSVRADTQEVLQPES